MRMHHWPATRRSRQPLPVDPFGIERADWPGSRSPVAPGSLPAAGHDEAGSDCVHPYAVARMLPSSCLREADHCVLGGHVRTRHGEADLAQDGRHVDHRAAAVTPHRLNAGALRVEDAVEVHTDHLVPGGVTVLSSWLLLPADAGPLWTPTGLLRQKPPVNRQNRASNEGRFVRGEEQNCLGHLARLAQPSHRMCRFHRL
jgi:hypothetical protein